MKRPRPLNQEPVAPRIKGDRVDRVIAGALRTCIDAHGDIHLRMIGSAAKRIKGHLRGQKLLATGSFYELWFCPDPGCGVFGTGLVEGEDFVDLRCFQSDHPPAEKRILAELE